LSISDVEAKCAAACNRLESCVGYAYQDAQSIDFGFGEEAEIYDTGHTEFEIANIPFIPLPGTTMGDGYGHDGEEGFVITTPCSTRCALYGPGLDVGLPSVDWKGYPQENSQIEGSGGGGSALHAAFPPSTIPELPVCQKKRGACGACANSRLDDLPSPLYRNC
jgi:hypothetical protein